MMPALGMLMWNDWARSGKRPMMTYSEVPMPKAAIVRARIDFRMKLASPATKVVVLSSHLCQTRPLRRRQLWKFDRNLSQSGRNAVGGTTTALRTPVTMSLRGPEIGVGFDPLVRRIAPPWIEDEQVRLN